MSSQADVDDVRPLLGIAPTEQLPPWACRELVATEPARAKLAAWSGRMAAPTRLTLADLLVELHAVGDDVLLGMVARVLVERLPRPVVDYALENVTFVLTGLTQAGFCAPRLDFGARPFVVVLGPIATGWIEDLIAHELAHVWLMPERAPIACKAFMHATVLHESPDLVPESLVDEVNGYRNAYAVDEQLARELTRQWGFRDL